MAARRGRPPMLKASLHVTARKLGDGSSAMVHLAYLGDTEVAAKLSGTSEDARRQCRREARRLARLRHPNIVSCVGISETTSTVLLATELMRGGSLFHALAERRGSPLPRVSALSLALQLSSALAHVHASGFSSGDVKSLNALLSAPLDDAGHLPPGAVLKLCDFGLSRRLRAPRADDPPIDPSFLWQSTVELDPNSIAGTFAYLAPECFERPSSTAAGMVAADVYALGVVLWELATAEVPWAGFSIGALMRVVRERRTLPWTTQARRGVGERYVHLAERCWQRDIYARPRMSEVVSELRKMYDRVAKTVCVPQSISYSDVSELSVRGHDEDFEVDQHSVVSMTSDESSAFTSIVSDDGEFSLDHGSFDITIALFDGSAPVQPAPKVTSPPANPPQDAGEANEADSSDSDSSGDEAPQYDGEAHGDDDDFAVFGDVSGWDGRAAKENGENEDEKHHAVLPDAASFTADSGNEDDEFTSFEAVVEVDECNTAGSSAGITMRPAQPGVSMGSETNAEMTKHVRFGDTTEWNDDGTATEQRADVASSADFHVFSNIPLESSLDSQKQGSVPVEGDAASAPRPDSTMATTSDATNAPNELADGLYVPQDFEGGPGFLEATNELSEFDATFRDNSSAESSHSFRRTARRPKTGSLNSSVDSNGSTNANKLHGARGIHFDTDNQSDVRASHGNIADGNQIGHTSHGGNASSTNAHIKRFGSTRVISADGDKRTRERKFNSRSSTPDSSTSNPAVSDRTGATKAAFVAPHMSPRREATPMFPAVAGPLSPPMHLQSPQVSTRTASTHASPARSLNDRRLVRDYAATPVVADEDLECFEDEDANADVLSSVMRFSHLVHR